MNDQQIKDKAIFVVGLLAAFLAFSTFKEDLIKINFYISGKPFNLLGGILIFILLLTFSVYLYALDYVRYSFGKYQNFMLFRLIIPLANFFYSAAVLFPVLIFFMWLISILPIKNFAQKHEVGILVFDIVGVLIVIVISIFNSISTTRRQKQKDAEEIEALRSNYLQRAFDLFKNSFFGESIMEAFKALDLYLREKLLEKDTLSTKFTNIKDLTNLAIKYKIIDPKSLPALEDLRGMRNQAAHSLKPFTKEQAEFAINTVRSILEHQKNKV